MILESIVTTAGASGRVNVAPMGPQIDSPAFTELVLKPFRSSQTFANLQATGLAVVHVTDDVELLVRAAIGTLTAASTVATDSTTATASTAGSDALVQPLLGRWHRLVDCCRWYAVEVQSWQDDPLRPQALCRVIHQGVQRQPLGWNRGQFAVIEATILATRLQHHGRDEVRRQMQPLAVLVQKTGGPAEQRAWALLEAFVDG